VGIDFGCKINAVGKTKYWWLLTGTGQVANLCFVDYSLILVDHGAGLHLDLFAGIEVPKYHLLPRGLSELFPRHCNS
jgi:hypothetical protein